MTSSFRVLSNIYYCQDAGRDSKGISKLPRIHLVLPCKFSCIKGSLEIPLLSLDASDNVWMSQGSQSASWRHKPGSGPELELTNQQQQFNSTWAEL